MTIRTINDLSDVRGKYILLRDDFNVQIIDGKIMDAFRIEQSMPTIRKLKDMGARTAIAAHLGRPDGADAKYSLAPIAEYMKIPLVPDCLSKDFMADMKDGDVVLLENVRFHAGEEENCPEFAKELARGFDVYVNDAFAVSHRAHASLVGVTKFLPSYAGELMAKEISELTRVMENPTRPLLGLISGAKIKSKIGVIKAFGKLCDKIILAGGIGTGVLAAMGAKNLAMTADNLEKYDDEVVHEIMTEFGDKIILPLEKGVGAEWSKETKRTDKMMADILPTDVPMDEGPASVAEFN
ncbi:MAG: phosphoglycerate kinase, partial [Alphaproteobacteria bacterium]|nr:phosphoglycerate kinase [Alphaproteobacteria bacterium]